MHLIHVTLSSLDCMSVGFFIAFVLRNSSKLCINLSSCSIDDHSIGLVMGELSKNAEACPAGVLQGVATLLISDNKIGDNGLAHIATALQKNTTMRSLSISRCSISDEGAESLARTLAVNRSLQELDISGNKIGDNGITRIATALQINTTMRKLNISENEIGDNGIAHIATALQTNNTLATLVLEKGATTDEGALSLAAALTANSSMKHLELYWSSTHPDSTLKKIGEYLRTSMLNRLDLVMNQRKRYTQEILDQSLLRLRATAIEVNAARDLPHVDMLISGYETKIYHYL